MPTADKSTKPKESVADNKKTQSAKKEPLAKKDPGKTKTVSEIKVKKLRRKPTPWWKDIALGLVNLVFVVLLIIFLGKLPARAKELRRVKSEDLSNVAKSTIEIAGMEVEGSREKVQELEKLFPDEEGLLGFVREIDIFKEAGVIFSFSFASEKYVRDKTGYHGIPFVVEFQGTWDQISEGLDKFQALPFLFRAVSIETEVLGEEGLIRFRYGGFLYVDESLAKD